MSQPTAQGPAASAPGASLAPQSTDIFTYTHLVVIALFALLVIVGIVAGVRLARKRRQGVREVEAHNELVEQHATAPEAAPAPAPAPAPATTAPLPADGPANGPVTQLKGLGPKLAERLAELGVGTVGQLAALSDDQATALDAQLGPFAGRLHRDRWQEQARFLAAGDTKGFEAVFGRL